MRSIPSQRGSEFRFDRASGSIAIPGPAVGPSERSRMDQISACLKAWEAEHSRNFPYKEKDNFIRQVAEVAERHLPVCVAIENSRFVICRVLWSVGSTPETFVATVHHSEKGMQIGSYLKRESVPVHSELLAQIIFDRLREVNLGNSEELTRSPQIRGFMLYGDVNFSQSKLAEAMLRFWHESLWSEAIKPFARMIGIKNSHLGLRSPAVISVLGYFNSLFIDQAGAMERSLAQALLLPPTEEAWQRIAQRTKNFPAFTYQVVKDDQWRQKAGTDCSFKDFVAESFGVAPDTVRKFRNAEYLYSLLRPEPVCPRELTQPLKRVGTGDLIRGCNGLNANQIPDLSNESEGVESQTFLRVVSITAHFLGSAEAIKSDAFRSLITTTQGKWAEVLERLAKEAPLLKLADELVNARDFTGAMTRISVLAHALRLNPHFHQHQEIEDVQNRAELLFISNVLGNKDLVAILKLSRDWHARQHRTVKINDKNFFTDTVRTWDPICAEQIAPNGYRVISLDSSLALNLEGSKMHNCVSSHASSCEAGMLRIFSIRTPDGERASTLGIKISFDKEQGTFLIQQNRATNNRPPSAEADEAAKWFLAGLIEGDIKSDLTGLLHSRSVANAEALTGFDFNNDQLFEDSVRSLAYLMPRSVRDLPLDQFLIRSGIDAAARKLIELSEAR